MCVAIPGKIVELEGQKAIVDIEGVRREANVSFIENAKLGDYVLIHAGFAIKKWTEEDVAEFNEITKGTRS